MPLWFIRDMSRAIPILEAEEAMRLAEIGQVGAGNLKRAQSQGIINRWKRQAKGEYGQTGMPRRLRDAEALMASLGVNVVRHE